MENGDAEAVECVEDAVSGAGAGAGFTHSEADYGDKENSITRFVVLQMNLQHKYRGRSTPRSVLLDMRWGVFENLKGAADARSMNFTG